MPTISRVPECSTCPVNDSFWMLLAKGTSLSQHRMISKFLCIWISKPSTCLVLFTLASIERHMCVTVSHILEFFFWVIAHIQPNIHLPHSLWKLVESFAIHYPQISQPMPWYGCIFIHSFRHSTVSVILISCPLVRGTLIFLLYFSPLFSLCFFSGTCIWIQLALVL